MAHTMAELHALTMAAQLRPGSTPEATKMAELLRVYQMCGDDLDHLVGLGIMAAAELRAPGRTDDMQRSVALLLALILWRVGPQRFARVVLGPPQPLSA